MVKVILRATYDGPAIHHTTVDQMKLVGVKIIEWKGESYVLEDLCIDPDSMALVFVKARVIKSLG